MFSIIIIILDFNTVAQGQLHFNVRGLKMPIEEKIGQKIKNLRYKNASFAIIEAGLATATKAKEACHLWQMTMVVYHIPSGIANTT